MDFLRGLRQAFDIVAFRRSAIREVAADQPALAIGLCMVALFGSAGLRSPGFPPGPVP